VAIHFAALCDRTSTVKRLLVNGEARISDLDQQGLTPLLIAAESVVTSVKTMQWMSEYGGADVTDMTPVGRTV
jgi:hypothetical protein